MGTVIVNKGQEDDIGAVLCVKSTDTVKIVLK